jgi:N-acetylmuramic acid 6-phosphate (MurNAc-6-P) etherase
MGGSEINQKWEPLLSLLKLATAPQSRDYVENKKQFQLHTLLTEQRHPKTWNLSFVIKDDVRAGLEQIFSVDEDISRKIDQTVEDPAELDTLTQAAQAVSRAIRENRKIFIYGCGSTGRLAKQMESALWRPFWSRVKNSPVWNKLKESLPEDIESRLIGEMTGGDRALISSLEGFEDLELVGRLQLEDQGIRKGDAVFGITEGGETSSVLGAVLAALSQYGELTEEAKEEARRHIFFMYNNPDEILEPFERSLKVIKQPAVSRINLTTGPQAVAGSTRMQATTIETFVMGAVLEAGIRNVLEEHLSPEDLQSLGFITSTDSAASDTDLSDANTPDKDARDQNASDEATPDADSLGQRSLDFESPKGTHSQKIAPGPFSAEIIASGTILRHRLEGFDGLRDKLAASLGEITRLTSLESDTFRMDRRAVYFAGSALLPVFVDCAERSPTFHLHPLDTVNEEERRCWLQVWTDAVDQESAWLRFLGRPFRGLDKEAYYPHFVIQIQDSWLRNAALKSLSQAGNDQELLYDFSFSEEIAQARGLLPGDLGVVVCVDDEIAQLKDADSPFSRFISLCRQNQAAVALILVGDVSPQEAGDVFRQLSLTKENDALITFPLGRGDDPLSLKRQTLLKMLLNAHSTAVMARLGLVVGNTMTNVDPTNLKLIGRATHLILGHVNDTLAQEEWTDRHGEAEPITYAQANAVLFDAMDFLSEHEGQQSEVALSIIRILEALREQRFVSWDEALAVLDSVGLEGFLGRHNPALRRTP